MYHYTKTLTNDRERDNITSLDVQSEVFLLAFAILCQPRCKIVTIKKRNIYLGEYLEPDRQIERNTTGERWSAGTAKQIHNNPKATTVLNVLNEKLPEQQMSVNLLLCKQHHGNRVCDVRENNLNDNAKLTKFKVIIGHWTRCD